MIQALLLAVVAIWLCYYLIRGKPRLDMPGPRGWPVVGNMFQIDRVRPDITTTKWAKKYGDVFVVRLGMENWVFLNSYDAILEMLVKKGNDFAGRRATWRQGVSSNNREGIIAKSAISESFRPMKKAAFTGIKFYTSVARTRMEGILTDLIDDTLAELGNLMHKSWDIQDILFVYGIKSILSISLGERIDDNSPYFALIQDINRIITAGFAIMGPGSELEQFPFLRHFESARYNELLRGNKLIKDFWNAVFPEVKDKFEKKERSCVIHTMMDSQINEDELRIATIDLVVAGSNTTVMTLYALFNILVHYEPVRRKLQEEVDREIGASRRIGLEDRDHMPYMQATLMELMRYVSVGPFGVPHVALTESTINGYQMPAGTMVVANLWFLHHEESFWKDPWTFRPERFLDDKGSLVPPDHILRKHLMPFGAGVRVCPGEALATARIFLLIASVLQKFDFSGDDENGLVPCDPRTYLFGVVFSPSRFKLKMLPRK